jgi:hypothetical protein
MVEHAAGVTRVLPAAWSGGRLPGVVGWRARPLMEAGQGGQAPKLAGLMARHAGAARQVHRLAAVTGQAWEPAGHVLGPLLVASSAQRSTTLCKGS